MLGVPCGIPGDGEDAVDGDEHLAGDCSVVSSTFHYSQVELLSIGSWVSLKRTVIDIAPTAIPLTPAERLKSGPD